MRAWSSEILELTSLYSRTHSIGRHGDSHGARGEWVGVGRGEVIEMSISECVPRTDWFGIGLGLIMMVIGGALTLT